jgi:putative ABC transport system permease protein
LAKLEFYLIRRYLRFDKTQPFISISAILAFVGVCVGVCILMISMSLMNGMSKEFQKRLFTMNYPLTIYPSLFEDLDKDLLSTLETNFPNIKFSPFIKSDGVIKYGNKMNAIMLFGVDFNKEKNVNKIIKKAIANKNLSLFDIILGQGIKDEFYMSSGKYLDKVQLIFTNLNPIGIGFLPTIKRFNVKGYFHSGLIAYDKSYCYTSIDALEKIKHTKLYDGIHIYSKQPFKDKDLLEKKFKGLNIIGWWEQNGNFFQAQQLEKTALFIILMSIILIASLNIISSLLMTIMSRRKEIALLLSLGLSKKEIKKTFFLFGFILGSSGIILGVTFGFIGMYVLGNFNIITLPIDVYGTTKLPVDLDNLDFLYILIGAFFIVILSSIYPAKKASDMNIVNTLRYE